MQSLWWNAGSTPVVFPFKAQKAASGIQHELVWATDWSPETIPCCATLKGFTHNSQHCLALFSVSIPFFFVWESIPNLGFHSLVSFDHRFPIFTLRGVRKIPRTKSQWETTTWFPMRGTRTAKPSVATSWQGESASTDEKNDGNMIRNDG